MSLLKCITPPRAKKLSSVQNSSKTLSSATTSCLWVAGLLISQRSMFWVVHLVHVQQLRWGQYWRGRVSVRNKIISKTDIPIPSRTITNMLMNWYLSKTYISIYLVLYFTCILQVSNFTSTSIKLCNFLRVAKTRTPWSVYE